jgi:hypothetical protein
MVNKFLYNLLNASPSAGIELVEALGKYGYVGKAELVPLLLEMPSYQNDLARVLTTLYPTDEELATFFVQQGKDYLATPQQVALMINLYQRLKSQPESLKRLWALLDAPLAEPTVLEILKVVSLDAKELVPTLQSYGSVYLQGYQVRPQLAGWVIQTFSDLATRGYPVKDLLFTLFVQPANPAHLEILLSCSANQLTVSDIRKFLNTYGTNEAYIPFCCRSTTALMLLEQYAKQITLSMQTKKGAQHLSEEKMQLLLLWLQPEHVSEMELDSSEIEAILTASHLQISEQVQLLMSYGDYYLRYTQYLPHLQEYVKNYVESLRADSFDLPEQYNLFNAVCQAPSLDMETRYRLHYWQRVLNFFAHPSTDAQTLVDLAAALNHLPANEAMLTKLAQACVLCIQEENDLIALMRVIEQVPSLSYEQMLYHLAKQAAAMYDQYHVEAPLVIYINFVLTCQLAEQERFMQTFLDALLRPIAASDLDTWSLLHLLIEAPQVQPLSSQALEHWYLYLKGRGLLHKTQKAVQKHYRRSGSTGPHPLATGSLDGEAVQESAVGNLLKRLWPGKKHL